MNLKDSNFKYIYIMAPREKKYSKYNKNHSDEYEETVQTFKAVFKITPKTIDHLWHIGYRTSM